MFYYISGTSSMNKHTWQRNLILYYTGGVKIELKVSHQNPTGKK